MEISFVLLFEMSPTETFLILVAFSCVSTRAASFDSTCLLSILTTFKPTANSYGFKLPEINVPVSTEHTKVVSIPFARHHIIPRTTLRPFFIAALTNSEWRPRFVRFLRRLADDARSLGTNFPITFDVALNSLDLRLIDPDEPGPLHDMYSLFCWMPFNIFTGPATQFRSDDPNGVFEIHARTIVGANTFAHLNLLSSHMLDCIDGYGDNVNLLHSMFVTKYIFIFCFFRFFRLTILTRRWKN